jgi:hypothetical protein
MFISSRFFSTLALVPFERGVSWIGWLAAFVAFGLVHLPVVKEERNSSHFHLFRMPVRAG